jgi:hypothetical protein
MEMALVVLALCVLVWLVRHLARWGWPKSIQQVPAGV